LRGCEATGSEGAGEGAGFLAAFDEGDEKGIRGVVDEGWKLVALPACKAAAKSGEGSMAEEGSEADSFGLGLGGFNRAKPALGPLVCGGGKGWRVCVKWVGAVVGRAGVAGCVGAGETVGGDEGWKVAGRCVGRRGGGGEVSPSSTRWSTAVFLDAAADRRRGGGLSHCGLIRVFVYQLAERANPGIKGGKRILGDDTG
jgi:hypothetical protein